MSYPIGDFVGAPSHVGHDDGLGLLSGVSSFLLLAPSGSPADVQGCRRVLSEVAGERTPERVLGVAYRPDDDFFDRIAAGGRDDAERAVVAVSGCAGGHEDVETVAVDGDSVPACVRERVAGFDGDAGALCFDALGALVEDIGLMRTFRFVNRLVPELREADAVAHFHFDPDAHDTQAVDALTTVFDAVVRANGNDWRLAWKRNG